MSFSPFKIRLRDPSHRQAFWKEVVEFTIGSDSHCYGTRVFVRFESTVFRGSCSLEDAESLSGSLSFVFPTHISEFGGNEGYRPCIEGWCSHSTGGQTIEPPRSVRCIGWHSRVILEYNVFTVTKKSRFWGVNIWWCEYLNFRLSGNSELPGISVAKGGPT
jgi:hypothetical protein